MVLLLCRPCNYSGFLDPASIAGWAGGLVDVDWSNGKAEWVKQQPMEDETMLLEQFKQLKALDKGNKVWLYVKSSRCGSLPEDTDGLLCYAPPLAQPQEGTTQPIGDLSMR